MSAFLVVLDVDSTLIEDEVIELLADAAGSGAAVSAITAEAMNGRIDFEESLRARVATLRGVPETIFAEVVRAVTVTAGVPELIECIHANDGRIAVVSGGFHEVVDPLAQRLGLDRVRANRLEVKDGLLTGGLIGDIIDAEAKAATLREWSEEFAVPLSRTVVAGDGANDLKMMAIAGLSIGFDAKAPVRDEADILMDERDLSQILPLLGLRG